jgi:hypothetical protein
MMLIWFVEIAIDLIKVGVIHELPLPLFVGVDLISIGLWAIVKYQNLLRVCRAIDKIIGVEAFDRGASDLPNRIIK